MTLEGARRCVQCDPEVVRHARAVGERQERSRYLAPPQERVVPEASEHALVWRRRSARGEEVVSAAGGAARVGLERHGAAEDLYVDPPFGLLARRRSEQAHPHVAALGELLGEVADVDRRDAAAGVAGGGGEGGDRPWQGEERRAGVVRRRDGGLRGGSGRRRRGGLRAGVHSGPRRGDPPGPGQRQGLAAGHPAPVAVDGEGDGVGLAGAVFPAGRAVPGRTVPGKAQRRRGVELALHALYGVAVEVAEYEPGLDVADRRQHHHHQRDRQHTDQEVGEGEAAADLPQEGVVEAPQAPQQQEDEAAGERHLGEGADHRHAEQRDAEADRQQGEDGEQQSDGSHGRRRDLGRVSGGWDGGRSPLDYVMRAGLFRRPADGSRTAAGRSMLHQCWRARRLAAAAPATRRS